MTTTTFAASMLLTRKGEPAENARKNYEYLKRKLEGMGLKEDVSWRAGEDVITMNPYNTDGIFYSANSDRPGDVHGPLLDYNPQLLFAIAGQRPEGGVGCWYRANQAYYANSPLIRILSEDDDFGKYIMVDTKGREFRLVSDIIHNSYHLATIPELQAAFPCEENAHVELQNQESKPIDSCLEEKPKIKKGDEEPEYEECPDCGGDGKLTCNNPDHGFLDSGMSEFSRLGCPGCGHDPKRKVPNGGNCETCNGTGKIKVSEEGVYQNPEQVGPPKPMCMDCLKPYSEFGLDTTLPDDQWAIINPEKNGLLCANCIVNRAKNVPHAIAVRASIEVGPNPTVKDSLTTEAEPVNGKRNWKSEERITLDDGRFIFELTVSKDGIHDSSMDGSPDMTEFLRYVLQRHDELKEENR